MKEEVGWDLVGKDWAGVGLGLGEVGLVGVGCEVDNVGLEGLNSGLGFDYCMLICLYAESGHQDEQVQGYTSEVQNTILVDHYLMCQYLQPILEFGLIALRCRLLLGA